MAALELTGRRRAVVLGASNVSRGLARLAAVVRARAAGPADLFVAAGHGRGYGVSSRVWLRRLPSILGCGLWDALDGEPGPLQPPAALVTDVGNEILYGFSADQVAAWVREGVRRLADRGCRIAITGLPVASIAGVGEWRLRLLKTVFVPGCRLTLGELKDSATRLDERVRDIARDFGATVIDQPGTWYGFDAIHVRRRRLDDLWHAACDAWGWERASTSPRETLGDWAALHTRAAEVRAIGRIMLHVPQPVVNRDDLRLWLH
ncbi:MAG: hypothetical protein ACKOZU_04245 [Planctomycetaceae bacterium]